MSAGLDLALATVTPLRAAGRSPRVILISDGLANQGDASLEGLVARAQRATRAELPLTTVGVGVDFNETLMTALADAGGGNYYFVERSTELAAGLRARVRGRARHGGVRRRGGDHPGRRRARARRGRLPAGGGRRSSSCSGRARSSAARSATSG